MVLAPSPKGRSVTSQLNNGVVIVVIAAVLVIAGFFMYRAAQPSRGGDGKTPANVHLPAAYLRNHPEAAPYQSR